MRKDWKAWTVHINRYHWNNWSIGIDFYYETEYIPSKSTNLVAKICQISLLFFNITITKWEDYGWI
jgi:hypothetical protein